MGNNKETKIIGRGELVYLPIGSLFSHPDNPRKELGDLSELAESIKVKGIMQNLTVTPGHRITKEEWIATAKKEGVSKIDALGSYDENEMYSIDGYTVIIGHRRMAAAKLAGLTELPCIISEMTPQEQITTMLLENMQRSDLTVYEQAKGFQLMMDFGESVEMIAEKSGFSPATVRRRVKLLELDEKKFKRSEARGANLFEYMELDKIKDADLKNKVLDSIGTDNFKNELRKAIEKEEVDAKLNVIEAVIAKFATKITKTDGYSYEGSYGIWQDPERLSLPEDRDSRNYFYVREPRYIYLYAQKDKNKEKEKRKLEEEKRERENQKREMLHAATERAYNLRKEFIENVNVSCIKKNFVEILAYWMYNEAYDSGYLSEGDVLELLGITVNEESEDDIGFSYDDVLSSAKQNPEVKLWRMICLYIGDDERWGYYSSWRLNHSDNRALTEWYDFLCKLGYEMSDEEKALRDGTHELFAEKEEH